MDAENEEDALLKEESEALRSRMERHLEERQRARLPENQDPRLLTFRVALQAFNYARGVALRQLKAELPLLRGGEGGNGNNMSFTGKQSWKHKREELFKTYVPRGPNAIPKAER